MAAIALVLARIAFQPFNMPSGSMLPTLLIGDILIVSKFSYGGSLPKRGDVVVFKNMNDGYNDYIKRIVGLLGDHIQVRGGLLYVNGQPAVRRAIGDVSAKDEYGVVIEERGFEETLPGNVSYLIAKLSDEGPQNNTPEYVVPEGNLFVLGDNRDNSLDSRFGPDSPDPLLRRGDGVGFVPLSAIEGQAVLVVFSYDSQAGAVRWDRTLAGIH